jgi:hypothetical protein
VQGYFVAKPLGADEFIAWLTAPVSQDRHNFG